MKLALALFREGASVNLVPYKFLGFFKVINIICDKGPAQIQWIRDNLQFVVDKEAVARIATLRSTEPDVAKYLYVSGRCAVAHAFDQNNVVDPDDPADLIRLSNDLPVIRELARVAIERTFNVLSECEFHRKHLYELEGFRTLFGEALVARITTGEEVPAAEVHIPKTMALRVHGHDPVEVFESMNTDIVYVRDGCVRLRLGSACHRLVVFVTLDFARESLIADPLADIQCQDDGTSDAAKIMLQLAQIYRWWFGGNGVIALWDKARGVRLARAQPYMPPVNSRFPHDDFEEMERECGLAPVLPTHRLTEGPSREREFPGEKWTMNDDGGLDPILDMEAFQLRELSRLAREKVNRIAREVIEGIKKYPKEARLSGDDSGLDSFWEEWKYQVQRDESFYYEVYRENIREFCRAVIQLMPRDEQGAMWLFSDGYLEWDWDDENNKMPYGEPVVNDLVEEIYGAIYAIAESEELKFDPDIADEDEYDEDEDGDADVE